MRKQLIICSVLALAAALTASLAAAAPAPRTVKVGDNYFYSSSPRVPTINVKRNTTIRFKWVKSTAHNVFGYRGSTKKFSSPIRQTKGYVYSKKLTTTGTFRIVCDIHGAYDQSMRIRVVNP